MMEIKKLHWYGNIEQDKRIRGCVYDLFEDQFQFSIVRKNDDLFFINHHNDSPAEKIETVDEGQKLAQEYFENQVKKMVSKYIEE